MNNKFNLEDLKSGYVVKLRNGKFYMVTRVGQFTKALVSDTGGSWLYLSSYDSKLNSKIYKPDSICIMKSIHPTRDNQFDIMEVYGLIQGSEYYHTALCVSSYNRKLLWSRQKVVRMTLQQVCDKLGYDVELIPEGGDN